MVGTDYLVVATNMLSMITPVILTADGSTPAAGNGWVRFLHASPDAPAVDIAVADGGPVLFPNVTFQQFSEHAPVAAGTYDLEARIAGTFGQAMPGFASDDLIPSGMMKRILYFTENGNYRSNIGILNGTGSSMTINWRRYTADGMMVDEASAELPAWGNVQLNRVFNAEAPVEGGYIDVWTETDGASFAAYGSVLDNDTSDPTTVLPQ